MERITHSPFQPRRIDHFNHLHQQQQQQQQQQHQPQKSQQNKQFSQPSIYYAKQPPTTPIIHSISSQPSFATCSHTFTPIRVVVAPHPPPHDKTTRSVSIDSLPFSSLIKPHQLQVQSQTQRSSQSIPSKSILFASNANFLTKRTSDLDPLSTHMISLQHRDTSPIRYIKTHTSVQHSPSPAKQQLQPHPSPHIFPQRPSNQQQIPTINKQLQQQQVQQSIIIDRNHTTTPMKPYVLLPQQNQNLSHIKQPQQQLPISQPLSNRSISPLDSASRNQQYQHTLVSFEEQQRKSRMEQQILTTRMINTSRQSQPAQQMKTTTKQLSPPSKMNNVLEHSPNRISHARSISTNSIQIPYSTLEVQQIGGQEKQHVNSVYHQSTSTIPSTNLTLRSENIQTTHSPIQLLLTSTTPCFSARQVSMFSNQLIPPKEDITKPRITPETGIPSSREHSVHSQEEEEEEQKQTQNNSVHLQSFSQNQSLAVPSSQTEQKLSLEARLNNLTAVSLELLTTRNKPPPSNEIKEQEPKKLSRNNQFIEKDFPIVNANYRMEQIQLKIDEIKEGFAKKKQKTQQATTLSPKNKELPSNSNKIISTKSLLKNRPDPLDSRPLQPQPAAAAVAPAITTINFQTPTGVQLKSTSVNFLDHMQLTSIKNNHMKDTFSDKFSSCSFMVDALTQQQEKTSPFQNQNSSFLDHQPITINNQIHPFQQQQQEVIVSTDNHLLSNSNKDSLTIKLHNLVQDLIKSDGNEKKQVELSEKQETPNKSLSRRKVPKLNLTSNLSNQTIISHPPTNETSNIQIIEVYQKEMESQINISEQNCSYPMDKDIIKSNFQTATSQLAQSVRPNQDDILLQHLQSEADPNQINQYSLVISAPNENKNGIGNPIDSNRNNLAEINEPDQPLSQAKLSTQLADPLEIHPPNDQNHHKNKQARSLSNSMIKNHEIEKLGTFHNYSAFYNQLNALSNQSLNSNNKNLQFNESLSESKENINSVVNKENSIIQSSKIDSKSYLENDIKIPQDLTISTKNPSNSIHNEPIIELFQSHIPQSLIVQESHRITTTNNNNNNGVKTLETEFPTDSHEFHENNFGIALPPQTTAITTTKTTTTTTFIDNNQNSTSEIEENNIINKNPFNKTHKQFPSSQNRTAHPELKASEDSAGSDTNSICTSISQIEQKISNESNLIEDSLRQTRELRNDVLEHSRIRKESESSEIQTNKLLIAATPADSLNQLQQIHTPSPLLNPLNKSSESINEISMCKKSTSASMNEYLRRKQEIRFTNSDTESFQQRLMSRVKKIPLNSSHITSGVVGVSSVDDSNTSLCCSFAVSDTNTPTRSLRAAGIKTTNRGDNSHVSRLTSNTSAAGKPKQLQSFEIYRKNKSIQIDDTENILLFDRNSDLTSLNESMMSLNEYGAEQLEFKIIDAQRINEFCSKAAEEHNQNGEINNQSGKIEAKKCEILKSFTISYMNEVGAQKKTYKKQYKQLKKSVKESKKATEKEGDINRSEKEQERKEFFLKEVKARINFVDLKKNDLERKTFTATKPEEFVNNCIKYSLMISKGFAKIAQALTQASALINSLPPNSGEN